MVDIYISFAFGCHPSVHWHSHRFEMCCAMLFPMPENIAPKRLFQTEICPPAMHPPCRNWDTSAACLVALDMCGVCVVINRASMHKTPYNQFRLAIHVLVVLYGSFLELAPMLWDIHASSWKCVKHSTRRVCNGSPLFHTYRMWLVYQVYSSMCSMYPLCVRYFQ